MKLAPFDYRGAVVVLTGAASGIGEQMARLLDAAGARLVLVDRHGQRLRDVAGRLAGPHAATTATYTADLGDRDELLGVADRIAADVPGIDMLVNNAGVALFGRFDEMSVDEFDRVTHVNLRAPVYLTHTVLPCLKRRPGSQIVNISSLFGLIAPGGQSAYCTSKFGLRGFSGSLAVELAGDRIGVTTVHPGGVATRVATDGRRAEGMSEQSFARQQEASRRLLTMPPEKAATLILKAAQQRRERLVIGADARLPDLVARLLPGRMNRIITRFAPHA